MKEIRDIIVFITELFEMIFTIVITIGTIAGIIFLIRIVETMAI